MATAPAFAATPRNSSVLISTANTNRDGTGTVGTVFTAGSSGSRVDEVTVKAQGTTTAGMVRLFIHNGTAYFLYREVAIPAITPSASLQTAEFPIPFANCILPSGWSLRASTHNAETFAVTATGGDF